MITNGYPWMKLQSADQEQEQDQEQVERTPGIRRRLKPARRFLQTWEEQIGRRNFDI